MKVILGNPGSGKTKALIEMSSVNNVPILCESKARQERLIEKARCYGFTIPQPIVFNEVTADVTEVYVDDINRLLEHMLNVKLEAVTINVEKHTIIEEL